jgi:hypothetical protein
VVDVKVLTSVVASWASDTVILAGLSGWGAATTQKRGHPRNVVFTLIRDFDIAKDTLKRFEKSFVDRIKHRFTAFMLEKGEWNGYRLAEQNKTLAILAA